MAMRKYVPNDRDREIVSRMAAIPGVKREDIAFCVTNERTGRAINRRTLERHYSKELAIGMALMKELTMKSFVEQIKDHVWPATKLALHNYCGLKDNGESANAVISQGISVVFRKGFDEKPDGSLWLDGKMVEGPTALPAPAPPVDVTPPDPAPQPDYRPQARTSSSIAAFDVPASFQSAFQQRKKSGWMS